MVKSGFILEGFLCCCELLFFLYVTAVFYRFLHVSKADENLEKLCQCIAQTRLFLDLSTVCVNDESESLRCYLP